MHRQTLIAIGIAVLLLVVTVTAVSHDVNPHSACLPAGYFKTKHCSTCLYPSRSAKLPTHPEDILSAIRNCFEGGYFVATIMPERKQ